MLDVSVLHYALVRLDIRRPHDLLPVVWRVAPQAALWIGLNSGHAERSIEVRVSADGERADIGRGCEDTEREEERQDMVSSDAATAAKRVPTCGVVPMSLVSPLLQYLVGHPQEDAEVQFVHDLLLIMPPVRVALSVSARTYRVPIQEEAVHDDPLDIFAHRSMFLFYALEAGLPLLEDCVIYCYILLFVQVVVRDVLRGYHSCAFDLEQH